MTDKPKKATFEGLLGGEVSQVSIINEPVVMDYVVDFVVQEPNALARAGQRWRHAELISKQT